MKNVNESLTTDLKNEIGHQIMSIPSFDVSPIEVMKDINTYNQELGEETHEDKNTPDFNKLTYNPEDKTVVGAYMITNETDKTIEVLNLIEKKSDSSIFIDGSIPYTIIPHKIRLPKSQVDVIGDVEGKEELKYIKIPYWLAKKNEGKLNISRVDGKKRFSLDKGQGNLGFLEKLNDPDVSKMLKIIGSKDDLQKLENYMEYLNKKNKTEPTEATSSGAAGQFSQPLFGGKMNEDKIKGGLTDKKTLDDIAKKHNKKGYYHNDNMVSSLKKQLEKGIKVEMEHTNDKKIAKEIAMDHLWEDPNYYDKLKKVETTEATSTSSSGQYSTPAFVAKNSKNWRGGKKPIFPGGKFVKVKEKCKKFPYCNQGDINALKLTEKVIKKIANKYNLTESVVRTLIKNNFKQSGNNSNQ